MTNFADLLKKVVYVGIVIIVLSVGYAIFNQVKSQPFVDSLHSDINLELALWPESDRCYQNMMRVDPEATARINRFFVEGFVDFKWWGACDSKIPGLPLNAEAGKVIERKHGLNAGIIVLDGLEVGVTVRRRAVHHIWRHKVRKRHSYFPSDWKVGRRGCNGEKVGDHPKGKGCPSLGYYDGAGGYLNYDNGGFDVELTTPQYRWKDLTLPWPSWTLNAEYRRENWAVRLLGETGGKRKTTYDIEVERRLFTKYFWVGASYGRLPAPGWLEPLDRFSLSFHIRK